MDIRTHSSWKRIESAILGGKPDRTPMLGGWLACPESICRITGTSIDQYWEDPVQTSINAYEILGTDALVHVFVPKNRNDHRGYDKDTYAKADRGLGIEEAVDMIDRMPSPETVENMFDLEAAYSCFIDELAVMQKKCREMVYMPAQWDAGAHGAWYRELGYETFFLLVGLYPGKIRKLFEIGGAKGRCRSRVIARAVSEGRYPHAVLLGEDLCDQRGPMISPDFLHEYFIPQLRYGLEPLLEAGCKPIWHTDGNAGLLIDMLIEAGIQGFQGFQPECGVYVEDIVRKRTGKGEPLVIFGPVSVVSELPVLTPQALADRIRYYVDVCRDDARLLMFVSNMIGPDVPLENLEMLHRTIMTG
jgi:hypothetical protein